MKWFIKAVDQRCYEAKTMYFYESFGFAVRKVIALRCMVNNNNSERDTEGDRGDAVCLEAFEQQTIPDAETLLLTYLSDRACLLANESHQSPIEGDWCDWDGMHRKQRKSLPWIKFGYVILIFIKFGEPLLWIYLRIINVLRSYIKHSKEFFIR